MGRVSHRRAETRRAADVLADVRLPAPWDSSFRYPVAAKTKTDVGKCDHRSVPDGCYRPLPKGWYSGAVWAENALRPSDNLWPTRVGYNPGNPRRQTYDI